VPGQAHPRVADPAQVNMTIAMRDGRPLHRFIAFIARAIGSIEVPMTDKQLEDKFADLADRFRDLPGHGRLLKR
jgi:hypothetical protein